MKTFAVLIIIKELSTEKIRIYVENFSVLSLLLSPPYSAEAYEEGGGKEGGGLQLLSIYREYLLSVKRTENFADKIMLILI